MRRTWLELGWGGGAGTDGDGGNMVKKVTCDGGRSCRHKEDFGFCSEWRDNMTDADAGVN